MQTQKTHFSKARLVLQGLVLSTTGLGVVGMSAIPAVVHADEENAKTVVITIKYVNAAGETVVPPKEISGASGSAYNISRDPIDGYTYVSVDGSESGVFTSNMTVTYTLAPAGNSNGSNGTVSIVYQTADGTKLGESSVSGYVGSTFNIPVRAFSGYKLRDGQGAVSGTFSSDVQTVTFIYEKTEETSRQKAQSANSNKQNADTNGSSTSGGGVPNPSVSSSSTTTNSNTGTVTSRSTTSANTGTTSSSSRTAAGTTSSTTSANTGTTSSTTTNKDTKTSLTSPDTSVAASGSVVGLLSSAFGLGAGGFSLNRLFKKNK